MSQNLSSAAVVIGALRVNRTLNTLPTGENCNLPTGKFNAFCNLLIVFKTDYQTPWINTLPTGEYFTLPTGKLNAFCRLLIVFKINFSGIPSEYQPDWVKIRPEVLLGLFWVQTVFKVYQQTTIQGKVSLVVTCNFTGHLASSRLRQLVRCLIA